MKKRLLWILALVLITAYGYAQCLWAHIVPVKCGDKFGYYDRTGEPVIPAKYDSAGWFNDYSGKAIAIVKIKEKYRLIERNGDWLNNRKYEAVLGFDRDTQLFTAKWKGDIKYINIDGEEVKELSLFSTCGTTSRGKIYTAETKQIGRNIFSISILGNHVLEEKHGNFVKVQYVYDSSQQMNILEVIADKTVKRDTVYARLDSMKVWQIFHDDLQAYVQVWRQGQTGLMTMDGKEILPIIYDSIQPTHRQSWHYFLKIGDQVGLINREGEIVIEPLFYQIDVSQIQKLCNPKSAIYRVTDLHLQKQYYDPIMKQVIPIEATCKY